MSPTIRFANSALSALLIALFCIFQTACDSGGNNSGGDTDSTATIDTTKGGGNDADPNASIVNPEGIDVSSFQPEVDWDSVKSDGIHFAYAQASMGNSFDETAFDDQWAGMKAVGLPRGAYHFYVAGDDGQKQADNLFAKLNGDFGELPIMVDLEGDQDSKTGAFETGSTADVATVQQEIKTLLKAIQQTSGKTPIIYTDTPFADKYLNEPDFGKYPLWIAEYPDPPLPENPNYPATWSDWTIWQYTGNGSVSGIHGDVDRDRFNGTLAELLDLK